jgi:hypothetical protein
MERKSKPQLESIINLLIHKHEIIIKYSNEARKAKKSEEQQEKSCVVGVWFTSPSSQFCTPVDDCTGRWSEELFLARQLEGIH